MSGRSHKLRQRVHTTSLSGPRRAVAAVAVVAAALTAAGTPPAAAESRGARDVVRTGLERLVTDDRFPAALAATFDRDGRTRNYTAGVADLRTGAKVPVDGQVRAGSNTKAFTATVVLQPVGEGKVRLDAPIEKYLPDLVRGEGIDGRHITVRRLLQHTSGLPDYPNFMADAIVGRASRHTYYQPRALLDVALAHKARFGPGTSWAYSNTNYVLAGLLIEKVTGRPVAEQITQRVIDREGPHPRRRPPRHHPVQEVRAGSPSPPARDGRRYGTAARARSNGAGGKAVRFRGVLALRTRGPAI
ncbi:MULTISPECIES: serine hydrolase domain-containing protein [unclassified Streptomyces]|uniref:serine hydrolase domain-containing protein n=1 Tax=unclassified Streptomyces TaxID=2593676 RepID=UPI00381709E9